MTNQEEKWASESSGYELIPCFDAAPMAGPGRWAFIGDNVLYTNDSNILFVDGDTDLSTYMYEEMDKAFAAGKTATETFERLRGNAAVVSGDLSELG